MKKILIFLLLSFVCFANISLKEDYEKHWKKGIKELKIIYNNLEENNYLDTKLENLKVYSDYPLENLIQKRNFYLFDDKLYQVEIVLSNKTDLNQVQDLFFDLTDKYGSTYENLEITYTKERFKYKGNSKNWLKENLKIEYKGLDKFSLKDEFRTSSLYLIYSYPKITEIFTNKSKLKIKKEEN